ncbi:VIT and VWA domain-containing protein [Alcanivorax sp. DP30]|uniref:VIT and vWA domain-containing protein n=1 Tax=Alcanivorax sp. DP30 TaxID=2606217 RepID=UPI00136EA8A8|nr:VIT and VWA domain-containing protein [Alcanivorax sp. DP30]MZR63231.1 VWA domain-containing protein [Alcanivorax sp. DP30]
MALPHRLGHLLAGLSLLLTLTLSQSLHAAGLMQPVNTTFPALQIREQHVTVDVEDGYAITEVEQVFHNPNDQDLEAYYRFPVPEKGTVAEFTVWIDGKPVTGEVLEKQKAREVYQQEKAAGRDAGLTEKDSYKAFDVFVSPVRAGQNTRVKLVYLQPAFIDTSIGRYVYPLEEGGVDEQTLSFWTANEAVKEHFTFTMNLRSSYPVDAVRLPAHPQALVTQSGPQKWTVKIDNRSVAHQEGQPQNNAAPPAFRLDQDIVVYWRHKAGLPGAVDLVAYKAPGKDRGTFMMTLTPGDDLPPISNGSDWIFVLDISGSMQGKLATLADGVSKALGKMRPEDRFRIVLFDDRAEEMTSGFVTATPESVQRYTGKLSRLQTRGGTNLFGGLSLALNPLDADRPTGIVLVTDGVANVGKTRQKDFLELLEKHDVRLFTFVMGNSANRPLLTAMTDASNGFAISVSNSDDIVGQILTATSKLTHQAMNDVHIDIDGVRTADLQPQRIGTVYHGRQIILMGHYWGDGPANVTFKANVGGEDKTYRTGFDFPKQGGANPELERLWAYATIQQMQREIDNFGEEKDLQNGIVDLGIEYGLVTNYTSMVVLRDEMFAQYGIDRRNAKRRELEKLAQAQRQSVPPTSNRVDNAQPMYTSSRPSFSGGGGGGAFSLGALLPFLILLVAGQRRRRS